MWQPEDLSQQRPSHPVQCCPHLVWAARGPLPRCSAQGSQLRQPSAPWSHRAALPSGLLPVSTSHASASDVLPRCHLRSDAAQQGKTARFCLTEAIAASLSRAAWSEVLHDARRQRAASPLLARYAPTVSASLSVCAGFVGDESAAPGLRHGVPRVSLARLFLSDSLACREKNPQTVGKQLL